MWKSAVSGHRLEALEKLSRERVCQAMKRRFRAEEQACSEAWK